ncbi:cryptococcal mannosyltransferase 1-domain-containing protein [Syncephalastrum racemosum]|uniref:Cryptococcal mannosyltransferase 1-domain-containing protein n=1 Tax=Syncephalastrum racemosum TaxID=13706 RepID=A0A1X2H2A0_SYNRA|nr:cryptococcal mannosyltransferase 1-domain-containing protein [Syncephalastrum racemosum]
MWMRTRRLQVLAFILLCSTVLLLCFPLYSQRSLFAPPSSGLSDDGTYRPSLFIAANLHNNEDILKRWMIQAERVAHWAGTDRAYISVYESGSNDKTPEMLERWKKRLEAANIRHTIVTHGAGFDGSLGRMTNLAKFRNEALAPLTAEYEKILFINDVVYELSDAITLLNTQGGKYDAACAMDFFGQFYDVFATREITGKPLGSGNYPYFEDSASQKLLRAGEPVPVFSCWNGMVALNSAPFLQGHVSFRPLVPNDAAAPLEASECCLVFVDFRQLHYTRIFINPRVKVGYDGFHYWYARYILPLWNPFLSMTNTPRHERTSAEEAEWNYRLSKIYELDVPETDAPCFAMH